MSPLVQVNSNRSEITGLRDVDVHAHHSDTLEDAKRDLQRGPTDKPVMIVSDGAQYGTNAAEAETLAKLAKANNGHYEYLMLNMDLAVESCGVAYKGGWGDMTPDNRETLRRFAGIATKLPPRGTFGIVGDKFTWDGSPVTLIGASFYGSMNSNQVDRIAFLDALSMHNLKDGKAAGCNMTRIWLTNQWSACKSNCVATRPRPSYGLSPFVESGDDLAGRYDLDTINETEIIRMVEMVDAAWDRGIVTIVSLFDRNGLRDRGVNYKGWATSPYNAKNAKANGLVLTPGSEYPVDFLGCTGSDETKARMRARHHKLVDRVVTALQGRPVLIEVMNESTSRPMDENGIEPKWVENIAPFHRNIAARIKNPTAVWTCVDQEPIPDPGPIGEPAFTYRKDGLFLTCTPQNRNFSLVATKSNGDPITGDFKRISVDFDCYFHKWDPTEDKAHCLLWGLFDEMLPRRGQRSMVYVNAIEGQNVMRNQVKWGGEEIYPWKPGIKPGMTFHFHWHYDGTTQSGVVELTLPGQALPFSKLSYRRTQTVVPIKRNWYMEFGSQREEAGPEADTFGSKFSNLVAKFYK